ncbi:MAG: VOC family protein [Candidatus Dormibacterales bacterium]
MGARLNHVSVSASDMDASIRFYEEVFGLKRMPTPNFGFPTCWLKVGDQQLHLFQRAGSAPVHHHFALAVADFEAVYRKAQALRAFDESTGGHIRELPDGSVQMYLRDPDGNLVEVDFPDSGRLDRSVIKELPALAEQFPQSDENRRATLFPKGL